MITLDFQLDSSEPLSILCIGAHADDIEIGCGGTLLALLRRRPVRVTWVVLSADTARAEEARASAGMFLEDALSTDVIVHAFTDGLFPAERAQIKAVFRELQVATDPDVVFTHDEADLHQDHEIVGALTRETFRDHLILAYEIPKYDGGLRSPSVFVPVDADPRQRKVDLIMSAFATQRDKHWFDPELFDGLMRLRGIESASPTGYAEGFHCPKLTLSP